MYKIYVVFNCVEGKREEYINKIKAEGILDAIRAEDGCIKYEYYLAEEDKNQILLIEQWESKQHQQIHLEQEHMSLLRLFKNDYVANTTLGEFTTK